MSPVLLADEKADLVRCIEAGEWVQAHTNDTGDFMDTFHREARRLGYRWTASGPEHCQCGATRHEFPYPHDPACGWWKGGE